MSSSLRKRIFKFFLLSLPGVYNIEDNCTVAMVGLEKNICILFFLRKNWRRVEGLFPLCVLQKFMKKFSFPIQNFTILT